MTTETVRRDRLIVALPAGHALAEREHLVVADRRDDDFVTHAGQGWSVMNSLVTSVCAGRIRPQGAERGDGDPDPGALVAAGLGVAIVPEPTSALDIAGVRFLPLSPPNLEVDLVVAHSAGPESPLIADAPEVLRTQAGR